MSQSKHLSTIVAILLLIISCSIYHSKKSFLKIQAHGDVPAVPQLTTRVAAQTTVKYQAPVKTNNAEYQKKARAEANARKREQSETQEEAEARAKRFADSKKALEAHMQADVHGN